MALGVKGWKRVALLTVVPGNYLETCAFCCETLMPAGLEVLVPSTGDCFHLGTHQQFHCIAG